MADLWSGIGAEISTADGEWLYRLGTEVRGPVSEAVISSKLANGEIPLSVLVAREGGEFHPVIRVATFSSSVKLAQALRAKRRKRRILLVVSVASLLLITVGGAVGYLVYQDWQTKRIQAQRNAELRAAELKAERAALKNSTRGPELVALVSFGTEEEVQIRQTPTRRKPKRPKPGDKPSRPEPEESIGGCERNQGAILAVLKKHIAQINVCVEDEKGRDATGLPDQLSLDFIVQTGGSVTDFRILDRHYRTGPMNNCMIKVFRRVKYPSVGGSNCPVTIPIKIRS